MQIDPETKVITRDYYTLHNFLIAVGGLSEAITMLLMILMPVLFVVFLRKLASIIQQKKLEDYKASVVHAIILYHEKLLKLKQGELFENKESNNWLSVNPMDISKIEDISKKVDVLKTTVHLDLVDVFEMEELFDEIYGIFKSKMDGDAQTAGAADADTPLLVKTIINGKLVPVDLNIAISCGDFMLKQGGLGDKGTSQFNTRESKKKPGRIVGTFIKGKLTKVDLDSIEAREEQQRKLLGND